MAKVVKYGKITVTALVLTVFVILVCLWLRKVSSEPLDTYQSDWKRIKEDKKEDGATFAAVIALDSDGGDFDNMPVEHYRIVSPLKSSGYVPRYSQGGAWQFAFYGTDAADETFSFTLVGWAHGNGMAQVICTGDGVLGAMTMSEEPNGDAIRLGLWADTINLDATDTWPSVNSFNNGNDSVSILCVDLTGLEYIAFVIYDANGTAEASTIGVYGRPY